VGHPSAQLRIVASMCWKSIAPVALLSNRVSLTATANHSSAPDFLETARRPSAAARQGEWERSPKGSAPEESAGSSAIVPSSRCSLPEKKGTPPAPEGRPFTLVHEAGATLRGERRRDPDSELPLHRHSIKLVAVDGQQPPPTDSVCSAETLSPQIRQRTVIRRRVSVSREEGSSPEGI
jgi:hypothetical protein